MSDEIPLEDGEYFASYSGVKTAHIAQDGVSICGFAFRRDVKAHSKNESSRIRPRKNKHRRPWKRFDSVDDLPDDYDICGMCENCRLGKKAPDEEYKYEITNDVREMLGMETTKQSNLSMDELREMRSKLEQIENLGLLFEHD